MSTLYREVSQRILSDIAAGRISVGDRLPPEADYARALGVSRSTLRNAFDELQAAGVLRRRRRIGTEVISAEPRKRFNMATSGLQALLSIGSDTTFEITARGFVRTEDIPQLEGHVSETGRWLEVVATRTLEGDEVPFSRNRVYVPARFAGVEPLLGKDTDAVYTAIEEAFGISVGRVTQAVKAVACPARDATAIGLKAGAPALQIDAELFSKDGQLVEISVATFDPARFEVNVDVEIG